MWVAWTSKADHCGLQGRCSHPSTTDTAIYCEKGGKVKIYSHNHLHHAFIKNLYLNYIKTCASAQPLLELCIQRGIWLSNKITLTHKSQWIVRNSLKNWSFVVQFHKMYPFFYYRPHVKFHFCFNFADPLYHYFKKTLCYLYQYVTISFIIIHGLQESLEIYHAFRFRYIVKEKYFLRSQSQKHLFMTITSLIWFSSKQNKMKCFHGNIFMGHLISIIIDTHNHAKQIPFGWRWHLNFGITKIIQVVAFHFENILLASKESLKISCHKTPKTRSSDKRMDYHFSWNPVGRVLNSSKKTINKHYIELWISKLIKIDERKDFSIIIAINIINQRWHDS